MKNEIFEKAQEYFDEGNYSEAFNLFKMVSSSLSVSNVLKADAFNLMGAIIKIDPSIDIEDESGLNYFLKAIEFDKSNIGALLNIIGGFGTSVNSHRDINLFDFALARLKELKYAFTEEDKSLVESKIRTVQSSNFMQCLKCI